MTESLNDRRLFRDGFLSEYLDRGDLGRTSMCAALREANVVSGLCTDEDIGITEVRPWTRGGSETYICQIIVHTANAIQSHNVIVKALVTLGSTPTVASEEWLTRSRLLQGGEVSTGLIGISRGCVYQTYFPLSLYEFLGQLPTRSESNRVCLAGRLVSQLTERVIGLGFTPIDLLSDLRTSDGTEFHLTDLGADLGSPSEKTKVEKLSLLRWTTPEGVSKETWSLFADSFGKSGDGVAGER